MPNHPRGYLGPDLDDERFYIPKKGQAEGESSAEGNLTFWITVFLAIILLVLFAPGLAQIYG